MSVGDPLFHQSLFGAKQTTLVEQIVEGLIRYIATQGLRPGDRLPSERELLRMVQTSRLPLREAISVLKGLGVVEVKHGKGIFVRKLDLSVVFGNLSPLLRIQGGIDLRHVLEARIHLEGSIAQIAAIRRTPENLKKLEALVEAMRGSLNDRSRNVRYDMDFHQELARSTGNPIFHIFIASIGDLICELHFMYQDNPETRPLVVAEHEAILEGVRQGQPDQAHSAMLTHLENAVQKLEPLERKPSAEETS